MVRIVLFLLISYLVVIILAYFGQRFLQYSPDRSSPGKPADNDVKEMQELRVKTEDGLELLAWFVPPRKEGGRIIVLYHGNAGHIGHRAYKIREFIDAGYGVYLCEYRGFGGNPGSISEDGLYKDARSALKWLDTNGYQPSQWIIYGESIGSGPAVQMALEVQPRLLIIEAGFSSAVDAAKELYPWLPVEYLIKDKFDNLSKIRNIRSSLLMLHGDHDETIPYPLAQKLYDAANHPKQLFIIDDGHHNDLYEHYAADIILKWLREQK